jgi:hypothetical protein
MTTPTAQIPAVPSPFKLAVAAAERVLDRELGDYSPVRSIVEQVVRAIDDAYLHAERELVSALADGTGEVDTVRLQPGTGSHACGRPRAHGGGEGCARRRRP